MKNSRYKLYQSENSKEYYFNLSAGNGEIILRSEGYKAKSSAENGIESVRKNSSNDSRFEGKESKNGKFYFNLKASNGQVIGTSEMYDTEAARDNGIQSVMENGPDSPVEDTTE